MISISRQQFSSATTPAVMLVAFVAGLLVWPADAPGQAFSRAVAPYQNEQLSESDRQRHLADGQVRLISPVRVAKYSVDFLSEAREPFPPRPQSASTPAIPQHEVVSHYEPHGFAAPALPHTVIRPPATRHRSANRHPIFDTQQSAGPTSHAPNLGHDVIDGLTHRSVESHQEPLPPPPLWSEHRGGGKKKWPLGPVQPKPASIPGGRQRPAWKQPYSYGYFGASGTRRWQTHHGYRDRYTEYRYQ